MTEPPLGPVAGWYDDPADPANLRYWDGVAWSDHVQPKQSAWSTAEWPQPTMAPVAGYATYTPQVSPLTNSGMRRVGAFFDEMGLILKRAWWPLTAVSLLIWLAAFVIVGALTALLVDFGQVGRAMSLLMDAAAEYPNTTLPDEVSERIGQAFLDSLRTQSAWAWVLAGVMAMLVMTFAQCALLAAINRIGMDAASGQPVTIGSALGSAFAGGLRIFGYALVIGAAVIGLTVLWGVSVAATAQINGGLAFLVGFFGALALGVLGVVIGIRLLPMTAQAVVARRSLQWSWQASRGKFMAILGRALLWWLAAGIIGQIVLTAISFPVMLVISPALSGSDPASITTGMLLFYALLLPASLLVSAAQLLVAVPVWRDLTDDPVYRAIGADGMPVPVA